MSKHQGWIVSKWLIMLTMVNLRLTSKGNQGLPCLSVLYQTIWQQNVVSCYGN